MSARILVIDDEESIRFTFERFLRAAGHIVATAASCGEAMACLSETSFDLVFADIILEDGTGIDLLREIKARGLSCPVIMITGDPGVKTATDSIRLGAFDYIPKPVNQESLLGVTRTALKFKALHEENERYRNNLEAIFRSVRDAIITVDQEAVLSALNEAAMSLCTFSPDDIGKPFAALSAGCGGRCGEIIEAAIRSGEPVEMDRVECQQKNRDSRVVSVRTYPLLDSRKKTTGVVMVIHDDTQVIGLEKKLTEHRQFHRIIGKSEPMQQVYSLIKALAGVQTTVLITGESGTGKELVAEALHLAGDRSHKQLVKVNCSALPEHLLEAELFGHAKGSFTGAIRDNEGRFHRADGGTIFFDEIGDISPKIQVKLLRVLEESEFERVGSSASTKVNVRLIAATNRNLQEKVGSGEMREDFYYRLKVVEIRLPPLRDRREDIPLLLEHFRAKFNAKFKKNIAGVSADVLKAFSRYPWPGNVRELEHTMEHAFVLCNQNIITYDHLPPDFMRVPGMRRSSTKGKEVDPGETLAALNKTAWNKAKAARLLGIDRVTLYRRIKKFNLIETPSQS
ncbi:sigma-54 dependent transcriptional regulator [Desulfobulbus alkaliphilus]|uniref:sigma-54 dependent transcriptional regulator n=1 Tax=Desulfobulbus alkaliphilus TaxID=869814 RepID=UPI001964DB58|nr:sigma 54-interacting transcriptional regulator [Desulfobulbus alkaliphilus]MBM9535654.1 sigma 54-interacting transcriptional regulator [Desulfobulbus alkaliphilus]